MLRSWVRPCHPDAVSTPTASWRRTRGGQFVLNLRLKAARQVEPAGAERKVHPRQAGVEPGTQEIVWITAHRVVFVEQCPHPCA